MKRLWFLILVPISLLLTYLAGINTGITEKVFSLGFYKLYSQAVSWIFALVPFSVGELLLIGGVLFILIYLGISIYKGIKNKDKSIILKFFANISVTAGIIYFVFTISCGINYYRLNFEDYYGSAKRQYTTEELAALCENLIVTGAAIRQELSGEDFSPNYYQLAEESYNSFTDLYEDYPVLSGSYSWPKPVFFSEAMSNIEITGVFFPFTIEANVNVAVPSYQVPFSMLHEQAHQRGFMREDEANFIAFLAGKNSDNLFIRYSVYMSASNYAMNSLYSSDPEVYREIYSLYSQEQRLDKEYSYNYWQQYAEKPAAKVWNTVNDGYLKVNGQKDGVASYGKVTELLLMDFYS